MICIVYSHNGYSNEKNKKYNKKYIPDYIHCFSVLFCIGTRIIIIQNICNGITKSYNEPIKQDKNLKKISDLDIIRIRTKNGGQRIWEKEQHTRQSIKAK